MFWSFLAKCPQKLWSFPTFLERFYVKSSTPPTTFCWGHSPTSLRVPRTRFGSVPGICRQRALVRSPDRWWVVGGGFIFPVTTTSKVERYIRERRSACRIIPGIVSRFGSPLFISHKFRPFGREYITPVKKTY